ncbi:MAG TPA: divalent metal cation transporter, partial [Opitutales bacterium]|nr:divalent metal cation transporter [Opitutales bacterium]
MKTASSNEQLSSEPKGGFRNLLRSIGPALIVASVVVGPGSILTSSQVGTSFGYSMVWVLALACALMLGMTALSARIGVSISGSLCDEIRARSGASLAILAGVCVFLICTCFQFTNNLGVLAGLEPFTALSSAVKIGILCAGNLIVIAALFGFQSLYRPMEKIVVAMVALMIIGFAGNLLLSQPSVISIIAGLWPTMPIESIGELFPQIVDEKLSDPFMPVQGLIGTTFSIAGAFYLAYLVQKKGWSVEDWTKGFADSAVGIIALGVISLMIMVTAAAVLHGKLAGDELKSTTDVAEALKPLFGQAAIVLFSLGLFAGAFSSFLVNALIGGTLLSDGLGLGSDMDTRWPKIFTVVSLLTGLGVAIYIQVAGVRPVGLIVFAQSLTVLGNPVLAGILVWLSRKRRSDGERMAPMWMTVVASVGFLLVLFLAIRTAIRL